MVGALGRRRPHTPLASIFRFLLAQRGSFGRLRRPPLFLPASCCAEAGLTGPVKGLEASLALSPLFSNNERIPPMNALKSVALLCTLFAPALFAQSSINAMPRNGVIAPIGVYTGFNAPTFSCIDPCLYFRRKPRDPIYVRIYVTSGLLGYPSNSWMRVDTRPKRKRWMLFGHRRAD
jgi:hypothetical protein